MYWKITYKSKAWSEDDFKVIADNIEEAIENAYKFINITLGDVKEFDIIKVEKLSNG